MRITRRASRQRSATVAEVDELTAAFRSLPTTWRGVDWSASPAVDAFVAVVHRLNTTGVPLAELDQALGHGRGWLKTALRRAGKKLPADVIPAHVVAAAERPGDLTARIVELRNGGMSWRVVSEQVGLSANAVRHRYAAQVHDGRTIA